MITFPNIEVNLGLQVMYKREDGFHTIESVFYPIPFCDMLEVIEKNHIPNKIELLTEGLRIAGDSHDNLIVKAYQALDQLVGLPAVQVCLYKKIPMGAGLGGGSSDGAFMLKLLNDKFQLNLSNEALKHIASGLGSDCAFFIDNQPAYLFGKGHELTQCEVSLKGKYLVLLAPPFHSNTQLAYAGVKPRGLSEGKMLSDIAQPISHWKHILFNDFEPAVFEKFPSLYTMKIKLYELGAQYASMSGSGTAIYGIFDHKPVIDASLESMVVCENWL